MTGIKNFCCIYRVLITGLLSQISHWNQQLRAGQLAGQRLVGSHYVAALQVCDPVPVLKQTENIVCTMMKTTSMSSERPANLLSDTLTPFKIFRVEISWPTQYVWLQLKAVMVQCGPRVKAKSWVFLRYSGIPLFQVTSVPSYSGGAGQLTCTHQWTPPISRNLPMYRNVQLSA